MNKIQFFDELEKALKERGVSDIDGILRDYEELIIEMSSNGMSEQDIIAEIGSPQEIANGYTDNINVKDTRNYLSKNIKMLTVATILYFLISGLLFVSSIALTIVFARLDYLTFIIVSILMLICAILNLKNLNKYKNRKKNLEQLQKRKIEEV